VIDIAASPQLANASLTKVFAQQLRF